MSVEVNSDAARRFLEFYFGAAPEHLIGLTFGRPNENEAKARAGREDLVSTRTYRTPDAAINGTFWADEAHRNNTWFCTSPLYRKGTHNAPNGASLPALWFDLDEGPKLGIDGDAFIQWLREELDVSCWIKTSPGKAQGIFLLDQPVEFDPDDAAEEEVDLDDLDEEDLEMELAKKKKNVKGKIDSGKATFIRDELRPLLESICYYVGGDHRVNNLCRLLRLPGSVNIKYEPAARVKGLYPVERKVFTMAELRKKFTGNENSVPRIVFYAIVKAMQDRCPEGNRHFPLLGLIGTVRRLGMDRESCHRLLDEVCAYLVHDSEAASVDSTYELDLNDDAMWTLRGEIQGETFEDIVEVIERAVKFWIQQKTRFCKKMGIRWKPENTNPLAGTFDDAMFRVRDDGTYWMNPKGMEEKFSNFSIQMIYKVIRLGGGAHETKEVDTCELHFNGRKTRFEWSADKGTDFGKFNTIPNLPPKLSVIRRDLWGVYVDWLSQQSVNTCMLESSYYGLLDVEKKPTLLLPNRPHPTYVLARNSFDTADPSYLMQPISQERAVEYLTKLAKYYPTYHDPTFLWPAMGWFVSSMFCAFSRAVFRGFPVMLVSGLKETGKTDLINFVLARHFGCQSAQNYAASTQYVRYKKLGSNNLFALTIDEFKDLDERKTAMLTALVNQVWDGEMREAGTIDGSSPQTKIVGSMCIVGEHEYQDPAALDRTFSIRVKPNYLRRLKALSDEERAKLSKNSLWLHDPDNGGILGALILAWMEANLDKIEPMMRATRKEIDEFAPGLLRRGICISLVVFGLKVLREIYREHEVKFPVKMNYLVDAVFAANPATAITDEIYGGVALGVLFQETDYVIMQGRLKNQPLLRTMYDIDPDNPNLAYFDIVRWHSNVRNRMKISQSATLLNPVAFKDLLRAASKDDNSPILGFPKDHPVFAVNCVQVDLQRVMKQFKINIEGWKTAESPGEYE